MLSYISNSAHYKEVLSRVQSVKHTLWIGTADIKDLYVDYIETLVRQKHSKKAVKYMIPCSEKYLHNTYGIIVYQERIMMLFRLIANFDRGESDLLRKALGKRKMDVLTVLKFRFIEGGVKNGHKKNALEKVWNEMEAKGMYAFQKSHAVCYTWLAYQMAYLKANYPDEFKQVIEKYNSD